MHRKTSFTISDRANFQGSNLSYLLIFLYFNFFSLPPDHKHDH